MSNKIKHFYEFGNFRFSEKEKCLWQDEELLQLSPNSLEVLDLLLKNCPNIVSREEIIEKVWKDTFVDEANLTVAVSNLRKALGKGSSKKFIQTVPKKGYRFIAEVKKIPVYEETAESPIQATPQFKPTTVKKQEIRWHLVAIILLGVFLLGSFSLWVKYNGETELSHVPVNERDIKSVAVLPLKMLNEDEKSRTLSLGIADNLISRLGKLNRFVVRPLSAVEKFTESDLDALEFGKELKVDAVIVGTIQTNKDRLRLNVRLLDVRDGAQLWAGNFNQTEDDMFKLQDNLSVQVANNLVANLSQKDNQFLTAKDTDNTEAFQAYSKGRFYLAKRTKEGTAKGIEYFEEAIKFDENYAPAYVGIAEGYLLLSDSTFVQTKPLDNVDRVRNALDKAFELNPNSAEAYTAKATFQTLLKWDTEAAEENYKKAISINPNLAQTRQWYAWVLMAQKRFDEAKAEMEIAHELNPTSRIIATEMGVPSVYAGNYEEAERYFRQAVEMDENFLQARFRLWYVLHLSEKYEEAFEQLEAVKNLTSGDNSFYLALYAMTLAKTGNEKKAEEIYDSLEERTESGEYMSPMMLASLSMIIDKTDDTFKWFEEGFRERNDYMLYLDVAPEYKILQTDERFQELLKKINSV